VIGDESEGVVCCHVPSIYSKSDSRRNFKFGGDTCITLDTCTAYCTKNVFSVLVFQCFILLLFNSGESVVLNNE